MAVNQNVNKVVYGNNILIDLTGDTAVASDVAQGKTFHDATGALVTGTAGGGEGYKITVTTDEGSLVTCTDGVTTLTGVVDSSGEYSFVVPNVGTWNITSTLDGNTITGSVVVNDYTINLEHPSGLVLYENGESDFTFNNGMALDSRDSSPNAVIFGQNSIQVDVGQYKSYYFSTKQVVDFSLYENFYMTYECEGVEYTKSVSVSAINGQYYVGIQRWRYTGICLKYSSTETNHNYTMVSPNLMLNNDVNVRKTVYIKKIWFE